MEQMNENNSNINDLNNNTPSSTVEAELPVSDQNERGDDSSSFEYDMLKRISKKVNKRPENSKAKKFLSKIALVSLLQRLDVKISPDGSIDFNENPKANLTPKIKRASKPQSKNNKSHLGGVKIRSVESKVKHKRITKKKMPSRSLKPKENSSIKLENGHAEQEEPRIQNKVPKNVSFPLKMAKTPNKNNNFQNKVFKTNEFQPETPKKEVPKKEKPQNLGTEVFRKRRQKKLNLPLPFPTATPIKRHKKSDIFGTRPRSDSSSPSAKKQIKTKQKEEKEPVKSTKKDKTKEQREKKEKMPDSQAKKKGKKKAKKRKKSVSISSRSSRSSYDSYYDRHSESYYTSSEDYSSGRTRYPSRYSKFARYSKSRSRESSYSESTYEGKSSKYEGSTSDSDLPHCSIIIVREIATKADVEDVSKGDALKEIIKKDAQKFGSFDKIELTELGEEKEPAVLLIYGTLASAKIAEKKLDGKIYNGKTANAKLASKKVLKKLASFAN